MVHFKILNIFLTMYCMYQKNNSEAKKAFTAVLKRGQKNLTAVLKRGQKNLTAVLKRQRLNMFANLFDTVVKIRKCGRLIAFI